MDEAEAPKRGRPRKEEPAADPAATVRVKVIGAEAWDSAGRHEQGEEFECNAADAEILIGLGQVEAC